MVLTPHLKSHFKPWYATRRCREKTFEVIAWKNVGAVDSRKASKMEVRGHPQASRTKARDPKILIHLILVQGVECGRATQNSRDNVDFPYPSIAHQSRFMMPWIVKSTSAHLPDIGIQSCTAEEVKKLKESFLSSAQICLSLIIDVIFVFYLSSLAQSKISKG